MKINHIPSIHVQSYQQKEQVGKRYEANVTMKKDQVEISKEAKALQKEEEIPKARLDKMQAIKEQIEQGTYKIDAQAVARKLYEYYNDSF
ncbi:flagellar biosynthesis anti-sigma factor FlgM [Massilibacterium senegalense]|uniref:flagellar biosynthesis anti-sigma factor FlgM n=1 Tax=Massilibacterium senegalense TaxID=1632858 RepID=UPI0007801CA0|nr:flagellar biosynthesis anti-sigma factor FlgM [Massilibacterium senegalense]